MASLGLAEALACSNQDLNAGWNHAEPGGAAGAASDGPMNGGSAGTGTSCGAAAPGYYVDAVAGDDKNDGASPETAWKSLTRVNAVAFQAGDKLCLRANSRLSGQLSPQGSGSSEAPIVVDRYGSGANPSIAAGPNDTSAVRLFNLSYWELNHLEITNQKDSVGDYRGISVIGQDTGPLHHLYIRGCSVHDVTGEVNWLSGDATGNAPGITFETGWDASKRTGGIVFEVQSNAEPKVSTWFDDVVIEDTVILDCSFAGIVFKQFDGNVHWGIRASESDPNFTPHKNVVIRNNYLSQTNTNYGCNGMYITGVQNALIEGNVVAHAGTSAIELYYTDSVTVQHNETFGTTMKANGSEFNGINPGKGTTRSVIQFNYTHDNGDGLLLSQFTFGDAVVRYNVFQNNSRQQIYLHSDATASNAIYNNTFYVDSYDAGLAYGFGAFMAAKYEFTNNLFVSLRENPRLTLGGGITYERNLYFGPNVAAPTSDPSALSADPRLLRPGQGGEGDLSGPAFASLTGYRLAPDSPAKNAGLSIANNGGQDFAGTPLYVAAPDLGAYESAE